MTDFRFQVDGESIFFEDLTKAQGRQRRIAGIISTETRDRQGEIVLQKGLNFEPFMSYGYFNDNHSKETDAIIGWPEMVKSFKKGDKLPNGELAKSNCTWAEGYLLEGDGQTRADRIWTVAKSLLKSDSPRKMGFSIEGTVTKRMGPARKIVASANVTNCAVTNFPVNIETKLEALVKSLTVVASLPDDLDRIEELHKALTMGAGSQIGLAGEGPRQGEGAGAILSPESLESDLRPNGVEKKKRKDKMMSKAEAVAWVQSAVPNLRADQIRRLVDAAILLEKNNLL